ncbi:hypothetical protein BDB00DRAFT_268359 [Zychaea mexicana]|uniref:uncharacterized protein n=1 Tax=Zychaea mexicana TaxID=64656 RepID=UPI0022FDE80F|nr:uncharacterized protein BDB00DRAFT_268359 [Zychaea mexicana]KAI9495057.1 hypothetical protein BDB00DRAFT_268359 [Zychaea mexicana]
MSDSDVHLLNRIHLLLIIMAMARLVPYTISDIVCMCHGMSFDFGSNNCSIPSRRDMSGLLPQLVPELLLINLTYIEAEK